jgi:hypothetical protein
MAILRLSGVFLFTIRSKPGVWGMTDARFDNTIAGLLSGPASSN